MNDISKVTVTPSPHIKNPEGTRSIMFDVILALTPALFTAVFMFGMRALILTMVCILSCVGFEALYNKILNKEQTISNLSAVITGILLAFNIPVSAPLWMAVMGSAFAIIIVKMLFGGLGKNFMNPALAARAFLLASFTSTMTTWTNVNEQLPLFANVPKSLTDAITTATPLAQLKQGLVPDASFLDMALGQIGGCIGETSALLLIAGGLYLVYRKVISYHIPVSYISTVAIVTFIFPQNGIDSFTFMMSHLLSGGLMLGAIFMATDYSTSPTTKKGKIIFGIGCGLITLLIRYFGSYAEGVSYAILLMNAVVWLIDKHTRPRIFGHSKKTIKEAK